MTIVKHFCDYLWVVPAFAVGCMVGFLLLGMVPGIIYTVLRYGGDSGMHTEIYDILVRPAMLVGGVTAALGAALAIHRS